MGKVVQNTGIYLCCKLWWQTSSNKRELKKILNMEQYDLPADLKAQFIRLYELALADGNFSPFELKMLYKFGDERSIPKEELDKILLSTTGDLEIPNTVEKKIEYLFDFARMAWADGLISEDERVSMKKFAHKFRFLEENIDKLVDYLIDAVNQGKTKNDVINELNNYPNLAYVLYTTRFF